MMRGLCGAALAMSVFAAAAPAAAQEEREEKPPTRTRVALGAQLVPSYPGSDGHSIRPLVDVARARGDDPFAFEAPDESFDIALVRRNGFSMGPAVNIEGSRKPSEVGAALPKVGVTVEPGIFFQYELTDAARLRAEVRRGIGGHDAWVGSISADYVARRGDDWLVSVGPRITVADDRFHQAYFGVRPADASASGLPAFRASGGVQAVGLTSAAIVSLGGRWGLYGFAKYDRLVGDAARSPITRAFGSRNQVSGGLALTYMFGGR